MLSDEQIKAIILLKLHKRGNWAGSHTALENLKKGWRVEDLDRHGLRKIEKLAKELIREGLITPKPTHYGMQISLNPRQNKTILSIMRKFFPEV